MYINQSIVFILCKMPWQASSRSEVSRAAFSSLSHFFFLPTPKKYASESVIRF
jgi:hypothetical protein